MKNSWLIWFLVVGVVITVLIAFNYQDDQSSIPLSEIFPETEKSYPLNIEYEFVDEQDKKATEKITKTTPSAKQFITTAQEPQKSVKQENQVAKGVKPVVEKVKPIFEQQDSGLAKGINYSIQVASFKTKDRAQKKVSDLAKQELEAFVLTRDLNERGTWYRVYVGEFASKAEAGNYLPNVKKVISDSFIISLK